MQTRIIGIAGKKRSGKDTIASMICDMVPGTAQVVIKDPISRFCRDVFGWSPEQLDGATKEQVDPRWGVSPRRAQQALGELAQELNGQCLVARALREAESILGSPSASRPNLGYVQNGNHYGSWFIPRPPRLVVIKSIRFVADARAVVQAGGRVIRIIRPLTLDKSDKSSTEADLDRDELSLPGPLVHFLIRNISEDLADLHRNVERALRYLEILT